MRGNVNMFKTNQPKWKLVGNLADINYLDFGGMFVYKDMTGHYPLEIEVYNPDNQTWERFAGEETPQDEWWWEKLDDVADFIGMQVSDLKHLFLSVHILDNAMAYRSLYEYFGGEELGAWGEKNFTRKQANSRYAFYAKHLHNLEKRAK